MPRTIIATVELAIEVPTGSPDLEHAYLRIPEGMEIGIVPFKDAPIPSTQECPVIGKLVTFCTASVQENQ